MKRSDRRYVGRAQSVNRASASLDSNEMFICYILYFPRFLFINSSVAFKMFRDMLRFLTEEQYEDVILVAEMIPHIEMNVKPRGK
jgi:hypothetical protein